MRHPARSVHGILSSLVLLAGALMCSAVHADSVFKCRGADGLVAFQDRPCAPSQTQSQVEIEPAPIASAPEGTRAPRAERGQRVSARKAMRQPGAKANAEVVSYECSAANGELFYRHGACPKQISAARKASGANSRQRAGSQAQTYPVTALALSRGEVCRRMARAGSIGRAGHDRDETVPTYDRNLGRDPCRRY